MKNYFFLIILLIHSTNISAEENYQKPLIPGYIGEKYIAVENARVRAEPNISSSILSIIPKGESIFVIISVDHKPNTYSKVKGILPKIFFQELEDPWFQVRTGFIEEDGDLKPTLGYVYSELLSPIKVQATSFKAYLCNWYSATTIGNDDCNGTNSWYKVYFPEEYITKETCMSKSDDIFNDPLINEMFPDYKKPGDEMKAWVAGCDNLWLKEYTNTEITLKNLQKAKTQVDTVENNVKKEKEIEKSDTLPIEEEYIALGNTNVRAEPSLNSNKLGMLDKGTTVYVRGKYKDWYIIEKDGEKYGYVFTKLLSPTSEIAEDNNTKTKLSVKWGNYYALVIGSNGYKYWNPLETAENDATTVADILEHKYNFKVTRVINKGYVEIKNAIYKMREALGKEDNLLIYYAGHGFLDKKENQGYWIPIDASEDTRAQWINNAYITNNLKASDAKHILVVVDSCFSASLTRSKDEKISTIKEFEKLTKKKTRIIMTSGGLEPVLDSGGEDNHSVFAFAFIKALKEHNNIFLSNDIFPSIRSYVVNNGINQMPELSLLSNTGHDGGDFIFVPSD